ncbi:hypothetical protein EVAR_63343_1 [Eumeta japonica]|uniref:Uncharacterized protein n=1 Tax=Eumeta variegata TaxID=151549 RepID=A0A4C1YUG4_EUMVA|nr:hypothetical protein EVAR_63343_1 [Eumeta japonica]
MSERNSLGRRAKPAAVSPIAALRAAAHYVHLLQPLPSRRRRQPFSPSAAAAPPHAMYRLPPPRGRNAFS